ncbi:MAG: hypothetical protein JSU01_20920 [Bacteroidetes bacterium]|nr:hypothetical protein [Bacteroidota bacterium]
MNPFFDISIDKNFPDDQLSLRNLGEKRVYAIIGRRRSDFWGTDGISSTKHYIDVVPGDYDNLFIHKILKWQPIWDIDRVVEHHYQHFIVNQPQGDDQFLKHMKYVILPQLKKQRNAEVRVELFEQWLNQKTPNPKEEAKSSIVNHNIMHVGNIHAPTQFQQGSDNSVQTLHNKFNKEEIQQAFELLKKDIQSLDEQIRKDFAMEMDYAIIQLAKEKDIKPQLLNIGSLMTQAGVGVFSSLLASPLWEIIKPHLGFH